MSTILVIGTMDTKGPELDFVANQLRNCLETSSGIQVKTVDVSTLAPAQGNPDVPASEILGKRPLPGQDRGAAIGGMAEALVDWIIDQHAAGAVDGVLGIGGSGGTALVTAAMRALPIGLPKLMVSTMASGNTAAYVDCSDICMMYSVVDVAGLNTVSRRILSNAARAMAGMLLFAPETGAKPDTEASASKPSRGTLGMTMFGVTTPCVTRVREQLETEGFDCLVFHATGAGGRAMEKLVESGMIDGVLDITTTEVADEIAGGIMPGGPQRFDRLLNAGIPLVLSLGAVDMVNFGPLDSVPERYRERQLLAHNPQVTLMRTSPDENAEIAEWIARKLNASPLPWTLCLPRGGVSSLDVPGQAFHNVAADQALFSTLERKLQPQTGQQLLHHKEHINAPDFADLLVATFLEQWQAVHTK